MTSQGIYVWDIVSLWTKWVWGTKKTRSWEWKCCFLQTHSAFESIWHWKESRARAFKDSRSRFLQIWNLIHWNAEQSSKLPRTRFQIETLKIQRASFKIIFAQSRYVAFNSFQWNTIVELCKAEEWEKGSWDVRSNPNYANCPPVIFSVLWSLHRLCKYRHRISFVHKIEFSSETRGILLEGGSCPRDNTVFKQEKFSFFCK